MTCKSRQLPYSPELILEIDGMSGFVTEGRLRFDPMNDDAFDGDRNLQAKIRRLIKTWWQIETKLLPSYFASQNTQ